MTIFMLDNELDRMKFYKEPKGTLYPPFHLEDEELKFENFQWNEQHRPKNKDDIFVWIDTPKTEEPKKTTKTKSLGNMSDEAPIEEGDKKEQLKDSNGKK